MTKPSFYVGLHELEDGPKELTGVITNDWLRHLLVETDVEPAGNDDGELDVVLTKNGPEVLVQGRLRAKISVPCARTLDPAIYQIEPEIFLMLAPAHGSTAIPGRGPKHSRREQEAAKRGKGHKKAGKDDHGWDSDPLLSEEEAALDTYSGDQVVLDHFLREFILLEVPMIPLREDLRGTPFEANPPLPGSIGARSTDDASSEGSSEKPLDPRFSVLAELKARLEKKE